MITVHFNRQTGTARSPAFEGFGGDFIAFGSDPYFDVARMMKDSGLSDDEAVFVDERDVACMTVRSFDSARAGIGHRFRKPQPDGSMSHAGGTGDEQPNARRTEPRLRAGIGPHKVIEMGVPDGNLSALRQQKGVAARRDVQASSSPFRTGPDDRSR